MNENRVIIFTMMLNLIVAILKFFTGIIFSFSTLIADSIQSFIDVITDITSLVANKVGKRRANKRYPFGYGQVYYIANLFTGVLLFFIGLFIVYQFLFFEGKLEPKPFLFISLFIVLLLKSIVVKTLFTFGEKFKSEFLIDSAKESKVDLLSTCVVFCVLIISLFESFLPDFFNIDKVASLGMAIYVFVISIKMIVLNLKCLLANDLDNNEFKEELLHDLEEFEGFKVESLSVIRMGPYYTVFLKLQTDINMPLKQYLKIERKIEKTLKNRNHEIRFIDIEPV